ncbi:hypothetical protein LPB86_14745 [Pedobacter sp. MC2016-14]|uniref:hypothetical protein n=1 Tax=Pedobacter sp. MC2016-14 TaxID=2897327 RepID=UPI001E28744A|nr:hypothetical protein [Pedobacter sp. MC2016-14]MCD0489497.1 hypothetical protein [Pedobacter sp. MC2016-14]
MAFNDGKYLHGRIGNLVHKKWRGKQIVQMRATSMNQSAATKKSAGVFGKASTLARHMRSNLEDLFFAKYDGAMINRLTTQTAAIVRHCFNPKTSLFSFEADSFTRLAGFEFNLKSPLIDSLWVQPSVSLQANTLTLNLPELLVNEQLKFPAAANTCRLSCTVTLHALHAQKELKHTAQFIDIEQSQGIFPAQEWTFEVPEGCLAVVAIGLDYFDLKDNIKTIFNSKTFNPAGICGALYNPGVFSVDLRPGPDNKWRNMNVGF